MFLTTLYTKNIVECVCCNLLGVGLQWSNINTVSSVDDSFPMLYTMIMLCFDIILYSMLTWYIDALLPGDFGTPLPFYFPFTVAYIGTNFC